MLVFDRSRAINHSGEKVKEQMREELAKIKKGTL